MRLSRDVTPQELAAWHFGNWNFTPGCVPPLHLVILQGDFDVRGAMPGSLSSEQERPAKFLIFVYDLKIDQMISLSSDPSGGWANQALGDPTLPHPDPASLPTGRPPAQIPCTPITVPGAPAPSPAQP